MTDNNESKEVIKIQFDTNADSASKDVDGLSASITKTEEATSKATKANKDLAKSSKESSDATKEQASSFEDLGFGIGDAVKNVKQLSQQLLKLLANPVVLFITAIVGALALLYKAFTSTNDGADKMEQVMAGVSATIDVLRDRILKVGGAIAKFFSGDFKGALADARTAVSGIGDEIAAEFNKAAEATARLQEVEDAMRDLGVQRAKINRDLVQSRELLQDENASYAQKKKALKEVGEAEQAQTALELANAQKRLKATKELHALSDISDEKLQEEADLQSKIYQLQEESARNQIRLNKQSAALDREEAARKKALADARKKQLEEEAKKAEELYKINQDILKKNNDAEKASLDEIDKIRKENSDRILSDKEKALNDENIAYQKRLDTAKKFGQDIEDIELNHLNNVNDINLKAQDEAYKNQKEADDKAAAAKKANQEQLIQLSESFIGNIQELTNNSRESEINNVTNHYNALIEQAKKNGQDTTRLEEERDRKIKDANNKNKALIKAAIIAEGTISLGKAAVNTAEAVTKDLAKGAPFSAPLVALDIAVGASSAAAIISNTAKALQAVGGGSVSGGGTSPSIPKGINANPQTGFQASSENQIATSINSANQKPVFVKAYVTGKDVTDQQTLDANLVNQNSFGGKTGG